MNSRKTQLGELKIGTREALYEYFAASIEEVARGANRQSMAVGLAGGSTPRGWYDWLVEKQRFDPKSLRNVIWAASDERHVPPSSEESNMGNAIRGFLSPLGFPEDKIMAWPVEYEPSAAALTFQSQWINRFGADQCLHICMLGMGEDCHTASLFPGSDLLEEETIHFFTSIHDGDRGWRYTITPSGLEACGRITVLVTGKGKRDALRSALEDTIDVKLRPIQLLSKFPEKVTFLCDKAAASAMK